MSRATADTPPQRFRFRYALFSRWYFGACVYMPTFEMWNLTIFGHREDVKFDANPWEVLWHVLPDVRQLEWLDNDMHWPSYGAEPVTGDAT